MYRHASLSKKIRMLFLLIEYLSSKRKIGAAEEEEEEVAFANKALGNYFTKGAALREFKESISSNEAKWRHWKRWQELEDTGTLCDLKSLYSSEKSSSKDSKSELLIPLRTAAFF